MKDEQMRVYSFETVDVFTDRQFGGNPLAVFPAAEGMDAVQMQAIAAEFNLSETSFLLPPRDPSNTARLRIFNRSAEMAFAGHPSLGAGFVLARQGIGGTAPLRLEVAAGVVAVRIERGSGGEVVGGCISAPQPLSLGENVAPGTVAACLGIGEAEVLVSAHQPITASVGNPYVIAQLTNEGLSASSPQLDAFRSALAKHSDPGGRFSLHVYSRDGDHIRARMFAPLAGTHEDPATGSANAPLAGLLLQLDGRERATFHVRQGEEMGRPSRLVVTAERAGDGIWTTISGACVPVTRGELQLADTAGPGAPFS
jgi:trans-2,3-dihydro-3-hydroxyanthranilate isomerase